MVLDDALRDLDRDGFALVEGALRADELESARRALFAAAEEDRSRGRAYDHTGGNQRVWALLNRGSAFVRLAEHPLALEATEAVLGEEVLLSNISANITGPGGGPMAWHADQGYVPEPWPTWPVALNVAWLLTDFTVENGATEVVAGSHRLNRRPTRDETAAADIVPLTGPAGSAILLDSRIWHRNGSNTSACEKRLGVFAYYCRPFVRTQENWFRSLDPGVLDGASPTLRRLLGEQHHKSLGIVDGMPIDEPRF